MNVGVVAEAIEMQSLKYVFEGLDQSLAKRHKVSHHSMEFFYSSPHRLTEQLYLFTVIRQSPTGVSG